MKPKPLKHKEENIFRFETFKERLQKIDISSTNQLKRRRDVSDEQHISYFAGAIERWQDLNLSADYKELRQRLGSGLDFQTLPQVLNRKGEIAKILIDGLKERKANSLKANLELLVALTRDLQSDFYEYFDDAYNILIDLTCEVTDPELIEAIFINMTYFLKYLWKKITEDIVKHFQTTKRALLTKKDHIIHFTAEVFSFTIKKSKNPQKLIYLLFDSVKEEDELSKGVGRIFFELIKGVNKTFITKSGKFLEIIFQKFLSTPPLEFNELMYYFLEYCCQNSTKESFKILLHNYLLPKPEIVTELEICKLIPLISQAISFHRSKLILEPNHILEVSISYISSFSFHQYLKNILLNSLENIFDACDNLLTIESVQNFCQLLFNEKFFLETTDSSQFLLTIFQFTLNISLSTTFLFDIHVNCYLSQFVSKIFQKGSEAQQNIALQFLASLIRKKRPRPLLGNELNKINKYELYFDNINQQDAVLKFVKKKLTNSENIQEFIYSMIVLSNISTSSEDLKLVSDLVMTKFKTNLDEFSGLMFVEAICALNLMQTSLKVKDSVSLVPEKLVDLVIENPINHSYLLALDLYFSTFQNVLNSNDLTEEQFFRKLFPILSSNLESFDRQIRLLSLHILTLFSYEMLSDSSLDDERRNIFQICLNSEMVPVELSQYRERLKHVRLLDCNFVQSYLPNSKFGYDFAATPVRYLLGSLYENLTLLWKPTLEIIETYVQYSVQKKQVVQVMFDHFKFTTKIIENSGFSIEQTIMEPYDDNVEISKSDVQVSLLFPMLEISPSQNNFDHSNHRLQLLKGFEMFSDIVEPRNREFVELFFNFLENEMKSVTIYLSNNQQSLRKIQNINDSDVYEEDGQEGDQEDDQENDDKPTKLSKPETRKKHSESEVEPEDETKKSEKMSIVSKSSLWKTYFAYLNVFSAFKNPKALFRESELLEMYLNMLISPNSQIQKSAMNCLYTYNYDYLNRYKDHFNRLLDDKSFNSEIHSFSRKDNPEDNIINENDRTKVIPIFLRIIFGKMLASSGAKKNGKSRIDYLRSIILKTVASFSEDEQSTFIDLIYLSLESLISEDFDKLSSILDNFVDIDHFMPFKQFLTLITTLESLMKHFGSKSQNLMRYMYKILIICSGIVSKLLDFKTRPLLKPFIIKSLKTFRINCFKVASYFFSHFDQFIFESNEIDALFETLLEPLLITLKTDSEESPSPLLKLFHIWTENPRYYCLLVKRCSTEHSLTPIQAIIQLYSENDKISQVTCNYITGMIENLLTYDSSVEFLYSDPTKKIPALTINNFGHKLPDLIDYPEYTNMKVNFGSIILVPFIKQILERINKSREKYDFTLQEINVLARISFFVKDPDDSFAFATLLLHSISHVKRPEEDKEVFTLKTLNHLSNNVPVKEYDKLLSLIIPLFYLVKNPLSRRELACFLNTLSLKKPKFCKMSQLIVEINAYDARFTEEPDYNRRIDAFKQITLFLDDLKLEDSLEFDFIHLLLNNCSFFLNKFEDISLKELSSNVLLKICVIFKNSNHHLFSRFIVNTLFLKIISNGLKHEKESVRHDYLNILWNCLNVLSGNEHLLIEQLKRLMCLENDEIDFWRNMKHIQLHRRARALTRLMNDEELLRNFSSKIFINFLIPIANSFVQDSTLPEKNMTLFGSSIDALATFLQYCSWYKYESTLTNYFNGLLSGKIDSKIAIKVISALLSKFTFLKPEIVAKIEKDFKHEDFRLITIEYSEISANTKKIQKSKSKIKNQKSKKNIFNKIHNDSNTVLTIIPQEENDIDDDKNIHEESLINNEKYDQIFEQQKKIYNSLCKRLLPMLHRCLHQRTETDYSNDKHHESHPEEDEIQRIPIALALVKLLKHVELNHELFQANITSIFLRLCQFLQSRALPVREASRSTLIQIMKTLGPKFFHQIFIEMKALLARGYQKHILIFTVHALLSSLTDQFQQGDLDISLKGIIDICNQELFGLLAEEKEISQITTKTKEAQKLKSYDIYEILAKFVSDKALNNLIDPLKGQLMDVTRSKILKKIEEALYKIGRGLVANKWLSEQIIMTMVCRILNDTRPDVEIEKDQGKMAPLSEILPKRVDYLLINQKALRRVDQISKINHKSHLHLLSNFALTCFRFMLKNNRLHRENSEHCEAIEPTIEILRFFLFSNDTTVITTTLFCFHELLIRFPDLRSFSGVTQEIVSQIFVLLKRYSGINTDNTQMISLCFKSIAHFVNHREESKLNNDEIAVLISYAQSEIEHNSQNATVYYLLSTIIRRKLVSKEMHQMMERICELAITTEIEVIRNNSITLSVKYLTEFPIEANRFKGKLTRLVRNLEYKTTAGRIAAGTILRSVINLLPYADLASIKLELFVPISARMINENDTELKKLVSDTVRNILTKLSREDRQELWETFVVPWLESQEMLIWTLGSKLCSIFLQVEGKEFLLRIADCLPWIAKQIDPTNFKSFKAEKKKHKIFNHKDKDDNQSDEDVSKNNQNMKIDENKNDDNGDDDDDDDDDNNDNNDDDNNDDDNNDDEKRKQSKLEDDLIFQHLNFILKILKNDKAEKLLLKYHVHFNSIFMNIFTDFLLHPHSWIRSLSTQIFGQIFSLFPPEIFLQKNHKNSQHFLFSGEKILYGLSKKFCLIFRDIYSCSAVQEQLIKNLVFVARVFILFDQNSQTQQKNLTSLISRMIFEVKFEIKNFPNQFEKRILLFKWIAAISIQLGKVAVIPYLHKLLPPLCREELDSLSEFIGVPSMNNGCKDEENLENAIDLADMKEKKELMIDLNKQVLQIIKKLVGTETFVQHYNKARNELSSMRLERRKNRAIEMVTNVSSGVKRKQRKHKRDKALKKKKIL